jgi:hypothetical protein
LNVSYDQGEANGKTTAHHWHHLRPEWLSELYDDLDTGEVLVQGDAVTNADDIAQLRGLKTGEAFVTVPRRLLAEFAPKDVAREQTLIDPGDEFSELFEHIEHTAWRLENRRRYKSDDEDDSYQRFIRGEDATWDRDHWWLVGRRAQAARGIRMERVRIVDYPPTVGQRYLLHSAQWNREAGEDIRNMWRSDAEKLQLPADDFWLFDSRLIALLQFGDDDELTAVELITDPVEVARACQVRDAAWHYAIPNEQFVAGLPSDR